MLSKKSNTVLVASLLMVMSGCGSSSGDSDNATTSANGNLVNISDISTNTSTAPDLLGEIPAGSITAYGAVTVGDDAGIASDLVASFFTVEDGLSRDFLQTVFTSNQTLCTVDDDDRLDFEEISAGFIPSFNGVNKQAISAGESITLTSTGGTFANMEIQSVGAFLFYTLPDMQMLPSISIPESLKVDIIGDVFPGYQSATLTSVETLSSVEFTGGETIKPTSVFSWTPSSNQNSMIRIFSSTEGGFFLENGKTVTCLAPDTGSFEFPASVQAQLGTDFRGATPIFSRIAVRTESTENSILFLIRESFVD